LINDQCCGLILQQEHTVHDSSLVIAVDLHIAVEIRGRPLGFILWRLRCLV
jgi:hypothetical protein